MKKCLFLQIPRYDVDESYTCYERLRWDAWLINRNNYLKDINW